MAHKPCCEGDLNGRPRPLFSATAKGLVGVRPSPVLLLRHSSSLAFSSSFSTSSSGTSVTLEDPWVSLPPPLLPVGFASLEEWRLPGSGSSAEVPPALIAVVVEFDNGVVSAAVPGAGGAPCTTVEGRQG